MKELLIYNPETGDFTWRVNVGRWGRIKAGSPAGHLKKDGYVVIRLGKKLKYAHRLVFEMEGGIPEGYEVDHINGNRSDNRRCNLRLATSLQNKHNTKLLVNNKTGVRGVHWDSGTQKFRVRLRVNGKHIHFGLYDSLEDAAKVAKEKIEIIHGDFCRENL